MNYILRKKKTWINVFFRNNVHISQFNNIGKYKFISDQFLSSSFLWAKQSFCSVIQNPLLICKNQNDEQ